MAGVRAGMLLDGAALIITRRGTQPRCTTGLTRWCAGVPLLNRPLNGTITAPAPGAPCCVWCAIFEARGLYAAAVNADLPERGNIPEAELAEAMTIAWDAAEAAGLDTATDPALTANHLRTLAVALLERHLPMLGGLLAAAHAREAQVISPLLLEGHPDHGMDLHTLR